MKSGQSVYWNARPDELTIILAHGERVIVPRCEYAGAILCLGAAYPEGRPAEIAGVCIEPRLVIHLLGDLVEAMR
jgi:hypothetical protein